VREKERSENLGVQGKISHQLNKKNPGYSPSGLYQGGKRKGSGAKEKKEKEDSLGKRGSRQRGN